MTKHLYLFRHAEATPKAPGDDDKSRELTQTGIKHAMQMGAWFREQNINFDLLVTSTATRAEQTAHIVAEGMKLENPRILSEDSLYEASVRELLAYINSIEDGYQRVLIVGHNPGLSYLAEYLTKADIGEMVPASVAIIKFPFTSWKQVSQGTGELVKYVTPEVVGIV